MATKKKAPPTSKDLDSLVEELRYAGDRAAIDKACADIARHLRELKLPEHYWDYIELGRAQKKNFAQRFSSSLAQKIADALRPKFPGVLPDEHGHGHESKSRAAGGLKKLDVNYSTTQGGLGLAISVKTINFRDEMTKRFTKNVKRVDGELRAEAQDCHIRHPYAVLVAIILLPIEAATDGTNGSSLLHAWDVFSRRGERASTNEEHAHFEKVYIGVYESAGSKAGRVVLFDANLAKAPKRGVPAKLITISEIIRRAEKAFAARNRR